MSKVREKLTYANVMVTLLTFIVLGGGAYAASSLPANSVGTAQLRAEAVTKAKIAKSAQESLRGKTGPTGATGATGPPGQAGPPGAPGPAASEASYVFARVESVPLGEAAYGAASGVSTAADSFAKVAMGVPQETPVKVDKLSVRLSSAPGGCVLGTCRMTVSLLVNDVDVALTCAPATAEVTCTSGSASTTIPAGTRIGLELAAVEAGGPDIDVMVTWRVSPA